MISRRFKTVSLSAAVLVLAAIYLWNGGCGGCVRPVIDSRVSVESLREQFLYFLPEFQRENIQDFHAIIRQDFRNFDFVARFRANATLRKAIEQKTERENFIFENGRDIDWKRTESGEGSVYERSIPGNLRFTREDLSRFDWWHLDQLAGLQARKWNETDRRHHVWGDACFLIHTNDNDEIYVFGGKGP